MNKKLIKAAALSMLMEAISSTVWATDLEIKFKSAFPGLTDEEVEASTTLMCKELAKLHKGLMVRRIRIKI